MLGVYSIQAAVLATCCTAELAAVLAVGAFAPTAHPIPVPMKK